MAKEREDMPRTDVGKEGGMPKHGDGGKTGGELGKQGGGEKKEWGEKKEEKGSTSHEPGKTGGMGDKAPER